MDESPGRTNIPQSLPTPSEGEAKGPDFAGLEMCRALLGAKTDGELGGILVRYCVATLGTDTAWMATLRDDEGTRRLDSTRVFPVRVEMLDFLGVSWHETEGEHHPVGRVLATGLPSAMNDIEAEATPGAWRSGALELGFRSTASLPVSGVSGLVGVLTLYARQTNFFSPTRMEALALLSEIAALAFEQYRVRLRLEHTALEMEAAIEERTAALEHQFLRLAALAEISIDTENTGRVLDSIAETTARLLPASCGASIILWDEPTQRFHTSVSTVAGLGRDSTAHRRIRSQGGSSRWIVDNREPLLVSDIRKTPYPPNPWYLEAGVKAFAGVPILASGEVLGVLYVLDFYNRKYTKEDVNFLTTMAGRVGAALRSARLLEAEREQRALAEALREVATDLNSTLDLTAVLERLLDHLARIIPFDRGFVLIERDGQYRAEAARGCPPCDNKSTGTGHCCGRVFKHVLVETQAHVYDDIRIDGPLDCCRLLEGTASVLTLPLRSADQTLGLLALGSWQPGFFNDTQSHLALAFAQQAAVAVRNANLFGEVKRAAILDPLTKVYNRGHFFEGAATAFKTAVRYNRPLSVFMLDIDNFKNINDTHGHQVGDEVLRTLVERLATPIRENDILGRYGGDEFAVLLPETGPQEAQLVAERLCDLVASHPFETAAGPIDISISVGIAARTSDTPSLAALLKGADNALYRSKGSGRNRVSSDTRPFAANNAP